MFRLSESIVRPHVSTVGSTPTPLCSCCHNCTLSLPQWPSAATHLRHWLIDSSWTPLSLCLCFIWRSYAIGNLGLTPRGIEESQTCSAFGRRLFCLCRYPFFSRCELVVVCLGRLNYFIRLFTIVVFVASVGHLVRLAHPVRLIHLVRLVHLVHLGFVRLDFVRFVWLFRLFVLFGCFVWLFDCPDWLGVRFGRRD